MLRRLVDVLTLSATPIPRTLYLALTGAYVKAIVLVGVMNFLRVGRSRGALVRAL